jgi:hypothetical protein
MSVLRAARSVCDAVPGITAVTREALAVLTLAAAAGSAGAPALRAQTAEQPNLILTVSGGYLTGGQLWTIDRQLAPVATAFTNGWDTLRLGRRIRPGFAATLGATYFASPHLGYNAEAGFFAIGTEAACAPVGSFTPDPPDFKNQQACQYLQGENIRGNVVGFLGGLIWRFTTRGNQPYVRAGAGFGVLGSSYVETFAPIVVTSDSIAQANLVLLQDRSQGRLTWMLSLGAGATLPLGPGYQLRIEARDLITSLPVAAGAATDTSAILNGEPVPPTRWKVVHVPTITVGLDIVLEKKRGHRY